MLRYQYRNISFRIIYFTNIFFKAIERMKKIKTGTEYRSSLESLNVHICKFYKSVYLKFNKIKLYNHDNYKTLM